ncbi:hypothetical protein TNCV_1903461 [Trichonephila clavipes]|nr:hypothetical protein TNCV_1903461 [Trichonephila clavipes]
MSKYVPHKFLGTNEIFSRTTSSPWTTTLATSDLEYPHATTHLQTSMPSPGLEPKPYGTGVSVANHYTGEPVISLIAPSDEFFPFDSKLHPFFSSIKLGKQVRLRFEEDGSKKLTYDSFSASEPLWSSTNNNQSAVLLNYCCSRESETLQRKPEDAHSFVFRFTFLSLYLCCLFLLFLANMAWSLDFNDSDTESEYSPETDEYDNDCDTDLSMCDE